MRTWKINIQPTKDAVLCDYFAENTTADKCMYNVANFYIRNTMTGILKTLGQINICMDRKEENGLNTLKVIPVTGDRGVRVIPARCSIAS